MPRLDDLLLGFGSGALEQYTTRKAEERKMAMELENARALLQEKERLASLYDPERMVANRLLNLARVAGQVPQPEGGYNVAERGAGIPEQVAGAAQERELNVLRHLLPRSANAVNLSPIVFDPNRGQYFDVSGAPVTSIIRGTPVRNLPLSEETIAGRAEAQARGAAAGTPLTPQQESIVQNFQELSKAMDAIDSTLASDPGFKGQLFATGLPFQPGAGNLADELLNASDILLRMRSGAQINEKEFNRLRSLLPRGRTAISELLGNPGRARQQVARFKSAAEEILASKRTKSDFQGIGKEEFMGDQEDFSQMTNEQLEAIVAGQ